MDLIYADENLDDVGVLANFTADLAFGLDENDFEVATPLAEPDCKVDYYLYIEHTEYGGIIDSIYVDTEQEELRYKGRTWRGIMVQKVIEPDEGEDYLTVYDEANAVVADLIERCGLDDVFEVSSEDSEIEIVEYQFRYENLNEGIFAMLQAFNAKLMIRCENGKVKLWCEPLINYATLEEFDTSVIQFKVEQVYNHINHLICLGQGDLSERHVIHLFTDDGGGVQPYLIDPTSAPLEDSDYILDKRSRVMDGIEERVEVYDYSSAEETVNYKQLTSKPADWDAHYDKYFMRSETDGDTFDQLERNIQDVYVLTTSQPSRWDASYDRYYTRSTDESGEYVYTEVSGDETDNWVVVTRKPTSWEKEYKNYYVRSGNTYTEVELVEKYYRYTKSSAPKDWKKKYGEYYVTDGVNYNSISGISKNRYKKQTRKPSDWTQNWSSYYVNSGGKYKQMSSMSYYQKLASAHKVPKWKKNTYYVQESYQVAPKFSSFSSIYYKKMVVPTFSSLTVYKNDKTYSKTWAPNTYYELLEDQDLGIDFNSGVFYEEVYDHYAALVEGGIERLTELNNCDTMEVEIKEEEQSFDVGDIVGAHDQYTGIDTAQVITKKIVKIERDVVTVRHEVGEYGS